MRRRISLTLFHLLCCHGDSNAGIGIWDGVGPKSCLLAQSPECSNHRTTLKKSKGIPATGLTLSIAFGRRKFFSNLLMLTRSISFVWKLLPAVELNGTRHFSSIAFNLLFQISTFPVVVALYSSKFSWHFKIQVSDSRQLFWMIFMG